METDTDRKRFDSKLVRLKGTMPVRRIPRHECFDSKLVRLKGPRPLR